MLITETQPSDSSPAPALQGLRVFYVCVCELYVQMLCRECWCSDRNRHQTSTTKRLAAQNSEGRRTMKG